MRLLRRGIRRERNLMLGFAGLLLFGGSWFGWYFFQRENPLAIFGLAAVLLGLRMGWDIWRQPKMASHELFRLLERQPEKIVWLYTLNTQTIPFGFHVWDAGAVYFMCLDGSEISVSLPADKLKMVSKFFNRLLPHAVFGYSEERKQQFEQDPTLLKK